VREELELRLFEERAKVALDDSIGKLMPTGLVRQIRLPIEHPAWEGVRKAELEARSHDEVFVTYWRIRRQYTESELSQAEAILLLPDCMFEPSGEECGTEYDYSTACSICGAGRTQVSVLRLDTSRIPGRCDLAFTIARDEFVISQKLASVIEQEGLIGARLNPVESVHSSNGAGGWRQLTFGSALLEVAPNTRFGINPFDATSGGRCSLGHVAGHAIVSELCVTRVSWDGSDFNRTKQLVGHRLGLLAPHPLITVSQRGFQSLRRAGIKGFAPEVVHLV
jgi:hypothetical protein